MCLQGLMARSVGRIASSGESGRKNGTGCLSVHGRWTDRLQRSREWKSWLVHENPFFLFFCLGSVCWTFAGCAAAGSDPTGQTFRTINSESLRASDPLCLNRGSRLKGQSPCCFSEMFSNWENRQRLHQKRHQSPLSRSQISTVLWVFFFPASQLTL